MLSSPPNVSVETASAIEGRDKKNSPGARALKINSSAEMVICNQIAVCTHRALIEQNMWVKRATDEVFNVVFEATGKLSRS